MRTFKTYFLSNFQICNTVLLIIVTMLYFTSSWHFITGPLYLFTLLTHFIYANPPAPSSGKQQFVLCIYELGYFLFVCFFRFHIWDHVIFVFLWLISLSTMPSKPVQGVTNGKISCSLWWNSTPLYTQSALCITGFHIHRFNQSWIKNIRNIFIP